MTVDDGVVMCMGGVSGEANVYIVVCPLGCICHDPVRTSWIERRRMETLHCVE